MMLVLQSKKPKKLKSELTQTNKNSPRGWYTRDLETKRRPFLSLAAKIWKHFTNGERLMVSSSA